MHPISLVSDADSHDNTDVDGEKQSQSNHHRGFHRGDRWSRICQTVQILSLTRMLCLSWADMNKLLGVAHPSFTVSVTVPIPHCVVNSDRLSLDDDQLRESCYEACAFAWHSSRDDLCLMVNSVKFCNSVIESCSLFIGIQSRDSSISMHYVKEYATVWRSLWDDAMLQVTALCNQ